MIGYNSLLRGLNKVDPNTTNIEADLDSHWEVMAEPIQMLMRRYGMENPYE